MKRILAVLAVLMLLGVVASAQQYPVTVIDDRGNAVTINSQPNRVVVAGIPLYTEILIDLGALDRLIAVAKSPDNPPEVADFPTVGPSFSPNVEVILSLEPDLVLGPGDWGGERGKLESAGITVLTTPLISAIPDIFSTIRTVGRALGLKEQAEVLIGQIAEAIITIEASTLAAEPVRAAFLYASVPDTPPYAAGSGAIENELILRAGGENVFCDVQGFPQVSLEEIVARDPEVILTAPSQIENITSNTLLKTVSAVKNGRVYGINAAWITSTKVVEALKRMGEFLHPEE